MIIVCYAFIHLQLGIVVYKLPILYEKAGHREGEKNLTYKTIIPETMDSRKIKVQSQCGIQLYDWCEMN
ncbi:hypothetical protein VNO77_11531 [Canavalia gladiata]|uniref:Uncharacterized protein n=1 Tax=Canavalia gladiata TaxID=3824 RepID=A0AAN9QVC0_CANGL